VTSEAVAAPVFVAEKPRKNDAEAKNARTSDRWATPWTPVKDVDGSEVQERGQEATPCQTNNLGILEKTEGVTRVPQRAPPATEAK